VDSVEEMVISVVSDIAVVIGVVLNNVDSERNRMNKLRNKKSTRTAHYLRADVQQTLTPPSPPPSSLLQPELQQLVVILALEVITVVCIVVIFYNSSNSCSNINSINSDNRSSSNSCYISSSSNGNITNSYWFCCNSWGCHCGWLCSYVSCGNSTNGCAGNISCRRKSGSSSICSFVDVIVVVAVKVDVFVIDICVVLVVTVVAVISVVVKV